MNNFLYENTTHAYKLITIHRGVYLGITLLTVLTWRRSPQKDRHSLFRKQHDHSWTRTTDP